MLALVHISGVHRMYTYLTTLYTVWISSCSQEGNLFSARERCRSVLMGTCLSDYQIGLAHLTSGYLVHTAWMPKTVRSHRLLYVKCLKDVPFMKAPSEFTAMSSTACNCAVWIVKWSKRVSLSRPLLHPSLKSDTTTDSPRNKCVEQNYNKFDHK